MIHALYHYSILYQLYFDKFQILKRRIRDCDHTFSQCYNLTWLRCRELNMYASMIEISLIGYENSRLFPRSPKYIFFIDRLTVIDITPLHRNYSITFNPKKPQLALFNMQWTHGERRFLPSHAAILSPILIYHSYKSLSNPFIRMFSEVYNIALELDRMLFGYYTLNGTMYRRK